MNDLKSLQEAGIRKFRTERPERPPLMFVLGPVFNWIESRHMELIREYGFPEARQAFNPVFIHLPADGCRLTELADRAGISKQAMSEIVEELIDLGYLARFPDPADGRAKLIVRTEKGLKAHDAALASFAQIDREIEARMGADRARDLRSLLAEAIPS